MLSHQAKDRLSRLFDDGVFYFKGTYNKADMLRQIEEIIQTDRSFSETIIEANQVKKKCNLGHHHCVYRLTFRVVLLPALRVLVAAGRPMTTRELLDQLDPTTGRMVSDYFAELRHWNLITQPKVGVYQATVFALTFLAGQARIPAYVWPRDQELPAECTDGPLKFVNELEDQHAKGDKARHLEDAIPSPQ